jgi:hypothetical protein
MLIMLKDNAVCISFADTVRVPEYTGLKNLSGISVS